MGVANLQAAGTPFDLVERLLFLLLSPQFNGHMVRCGQSGSDLVEANHTAEVEGGYLRKMVQRVCRGTYWRIMRCSCDQGRLRPVACGR